MKNFIQRGDVMTVTVSADTASGDVVVAGSLVGVAVASAKDGEECEVSLTGVYELPKATGSISQGAKVYFVAADKNFTTTASGNTLAGYAFKAAANGDATVLVKLAQ
jgi:predicted RecA/RadA family phage recombinase